MVNTKCYIR